MRDRIPTGRLRRRLTVAFALVAGLSALALAAAPTRSFARRGWTTRSTARSRRRASTSGSRRRCSGTAPASRRRRAARGVRAARRFRHRRHDGGARTSPPASRSTSAQVPRTCGRSCRTDSSRTSGPSWAASRASSPAGRSPARTRSSTSSSPSRSSRTSSGSSARSCSSASRSSRSSARSSARSSPGARSRRWAARARRRSRSPRAARDADPGGERGRVRRLGGSFNEMAEALQAKITALSRAEARERRFTSDVAHELRTPLTALVGEAELLGEHLDRCLPTRAGRRSSSSRTSRACGGWWRT